ncbi:MULTISPECIES: GNAT family N-acetyltransferase [unclassified Corynebacterium]|uniref:GNAT family N-acetyltransferase n=1 Tax=unclassified Corynebacterium TaxID=2624378 RepID=UPI00114CC081|nr:MULTISPECIES: GNAT family N-acetyltransferase [unclassified Corynebacterium]
MWRKLDLDEMSAVMSLRECVLSCLSNPDQYVREDDEGAFVRGHLGEFGVSFGKFENNILVAYCALTTDLYESGEISEFEVCNPNSGDSVFAAGMVHPEYRGRGLQRESIRIRIEEAKRGGFSRLLAQVSPRNFNSLQNLFAEGFQCTRVASYEDGRSRLILSLELDNQSTGDDVIEDMELVPVRELSVINDELRNGRKGRHIVRSASEEFMVVGS